MSKKNNKPSTFFWTIMVLINVFVTGLVIGLQIMFYRHLRPISSSMYNSPEEKEMLINKIISANNQMLLMMIVFGSMFLLVINYFRMARVVNKPLQSTLAFILSYYLITGITLYFISHNYYLSNF
jgi:hypothetical protein